MGILLLGSVPTYEGLVASRSRIFYTKDITNKFLMTRSAHIATEALTSIKLAFANFYLPGSGADGGLGASATVTAAVEYNGVFSQVLFSGSASGTIADISVLFSDYTSVSIPAGATFWVRIFYQNTAGTFYNSWRNTFLGEVTSLSATSISDQTMSGTITSSGNFSHPPVAILGMTQNPSVGIIGDSIANGYPFGLDTQDTSSSATGYDGKVGVIARSLGSIPFINLAEGGESAAGVIANSPARKLLWQKFSHMICELSGVDLRGSATSATVISRLQTIYSSFASWQKKYQTTFTPLDVTDPNTPAAKYTTLVQQTAAASNTQRQAFNASVRAGSVGPNGFFDVASILEDSLTSGVWVVSPSPPYTGDGIHPTASGNALVQAAGLFTGISWP